MNWDDLRYVLAICRGGSLSRAARGLGVNHSTVFRRIGQIESRLGVRLFERFRDGYVPTPAGEELHQVAERMEQEISGVERRLMGHDMRPHGLVRVTTTDTLLSQPLMPIFAAFRKAHPEISLEVAVSNEFFSLSKRDADVAVRPTSDPPETLFGRRISGIAFAVYASPEYLESADPTDDLSAHSWIAPDESLAHTVTARWMRGLGSAPRIAYRSNSMLGMAEAARAGFGLVALPCYLGDIEPPLQRFAGPLDTLESSLWLLTHRDLRAVARVRALLDFLGTELSKRRSFFEGSGPESALVDRPKA